VKDLASHVKILSLMITPHLIRAGKGSRKCLQIMVNELIEENKECFVVGDHSS
jgi:ribonucleotide monophosphatase NagD (HAD superfamily)